MKDTKTGWRFHVKGDLRTVRRLAFACAVAALALATETAHCQTAWNAGTPPSEEETPVVNANLNRSPKASRLANGSGRGTPDDGPDLENKKKKAGGGETTIESAGASAGTRRTKRAQAAAGRHASELAAAAPSPRQKNPTLFQTQFTESRHGDAKPQSVEAQSVETQSSELANAPARMRALEQQIAELRARLDSVTAAQDAAQAPAASQPSTVQGSVFGPDAPALPSGGWGGAAADTGSPSTVLGSVFGSDAGPASTWVNDGLTFVSNDGDFKTHLGGVVQLDAIGFAPNLPGITSVPDGAGTQESVTFRRLRVRADGTMYRHIDWVLEFDFALALQNTDQLNVAAQNLGLRSFPAGTGVQAGNTINVIQPTMVFMTFKETPVLGNVRVGNQADWFGFEHIENSRFLDFMERSPLADAFTAPNNNGYTPGVSAFNNTPDQQLGAQVGVYHNNAYDSGYTYDIGDAWTYGGRVIWTPYYDEESKGRCLVHTGFGAEYRTFNDNVSSTTGFDNIRVRSRGSLRNASSTLDPNYTDTGNFYATSQTLINPELAVQMGPFLLQSEYTASWYNGALPAKNVPTDLGTVFFQGGYVEALYFLTGENRNYNRLQGVFGRVIPNENWNPKKGTWGAWQVGLRYDRLDLNSGSAVNGGNTSDVTLGLNWFLNANARFQFNYVLSWVDNAPSATFPGTVGALNGSRFTGDGAISSFGARMDFNF